jgi:RNA polymerase sigma factor (sigma-70 family)
MERFYEVFFDRVYGYVRRMLNEDHLAEDVTQDVFMHIQRSIHTYDPARDPGPWVFTIATNKVRDFWRTRRQKEAGLEASLDEEERKFRSPSRIPAFLSSGRSSRASSRRRSTSFLERARRSCCAT